MNGNCIQLRGIRSLRKIMGNKTTALQFLKRHGVILFRFNTELQDKELHNSSSPNINRMKNSRNTRRGVTLMK
jgi:hypothetical protein